MSSNLKVNTILPSTGTAIGIGTAGGTVTIVGDVDVADKIVHTGDTNTSIRFPSSDTITFETNGGERFRITDAASSFKNKLIIDDGSNGHLFLNNTSSENTIHSGTTGFAAYKNLVINAAQHIFKVSNTEKIRIDSSGRVLINTTTTYPSNQMLYVKGGSPSTVYDGQAYLEGSETSGAINTGGTLVFGGHDGGTARTWGAIRTLKEDGTSGNYGSYMAFLTRPNGSAPTEKVRIDSSGRTLIGTTSQNNNARLQVTTDQQVVASFEGTGGADPQIYLGDNMASPTDNCIILGYDKADNRGYLTVGGDGDNVFTITNGGAIGINNTAPVEKLGISGNMRFVNPTGTTSRITALPSGSYNTGVSGGSAVCFHRFADGGGGSDEIFFETHWQGNRHGESMRINKYGHVTTPNQPSFNVTSSGGQINSNVGTIVFGDTSSIHNHNTGNHYSTSNGRFTAPVAGKYQINARMLTNSSTNSYTIYLIRVNGTVAGYIGHNHSDYWIMESGSWVFNLAANDYVDCYMQAHSGHLGHNYASFSGFLIG
tara:strand:+ start:817 stop:2439 length:1623 start_codon:yes stop_codon:yes gene_type:complete